MKFIHFTKIILLPSRFKMKAGNATPFLLVVSLIAAGNGLKCYVGDDRARAQQTAKDPTGRDAAHGLCVHLRAESGQEKANAWGWVGWSEANND